VGFTISNEGGFFESRLAPGAKRAACRFAPVGSCGESILISMTQTQEETGRFSVLVNDQGRYALWPEFRTAPAGWQEILPPHSRAECLAFVSNQERKTQVQSGRPKATTPAVGFGLLFFGGEEQNVGRVKYDFLLRAARFADEQGFSAVWLPERHFAQMGSLYPNPAILHAALSQETKRIRLRAGSVVLPLNDPIRVAEEWAIVDNLSGGRVEISFAPGWNSEDFALCPDHYQNRYDIMYEGIAVVEKLWQGESIPARGGNGESIHIRTFPTPVQPRLTKWITAAGSAKTCQQAGAIGANLLTHLFDQGVEELAGKIKLYREARAQNGHDPQAGKVAVTLHTFLAPTMDKVMDKAHVPYCNYLKSNLGLLEKLAKNRGFDIKLANLPAKQLDDAVNLIFAKFLRQRSLLGTPESCADLVSQLAAAGVNEIACLLDFGPTNEDMLESLRPLCELKDRFS
jgi:natural product biosynthesis luciferase-like monooxygenase protein